MTYPVAVGWKGLPTFVLNEARVARDAKGLIYVPYFRANGKPHNIKVISESRSWWATAEKRLYPFGLESLTDPPHDRALMLAEGESDALALRSEFEALGFDVLGLAGAATWRKNWLLWLEPYRIVYILADGDHAGDALSRAIKRDRKDARIVKIPRGEDARSLLQRDGWYAVYELLEQADEAAGEEHWLGLVHKAITGSNTIEECEAKLRAV